jgi:hypothetical protein
MEFPNRLATETLTAVARNLDALRHLEDEEIPDAVALATIDSARELLEKALLIVARLSGPAPN